MSKRKIMLALAMSASLAGCNPAPEAKAEPIVSQGTVVSFGWSHGVSVWEDPDTGCQYLIYAEYKRGGMTPRYQAGTANINNIKGCR